MLMVVFGAGASYDSMPSRPPGFFPTDRLPHRLPLANELFADRDSFAIILAQFPQCHPVVPRLRHLQSGTSVETLLEKLQSETAEYPQRHRQLAAIRYYLQSVIGDCERRVEQVALGITNYKSLLDHIERRRKPNEPVCLVTFNYDTMLEAALPTVGIRIRSMRDYISDERYKVIKLHGSVNWGREIDTQLASLKAGEAAALVNEVIDRAPDLSVSDRYQLLNQRPITTCSDHAYFPAIALPLTRKQSYECPVDHLKTLWEYLPRVRRLLLIGWRATDLPFVERLREHATHVERHGIYGLVVAGGAQGAAEVIANLRPVQGEFEPARGGFTDFILEDGIERFLG